MRLRSALVLTWLVFAGLATTAGFAAVGLVGDGLDVAAAPAAVPDATSTGPPSTSASASASPRPTSTSPRPTSTTPAPTATQTRTASRSVRGNFVSASCRGSAVTLSAAPAPGWALDDYRPGPAREARARFRSDAGEVEFKVSCSGGRPEFETEDDPDGDGGDD